MRRTTLVLVLLGAAILSARICSGDDVGKQYDFLLKGMNDQRQRLRTGVYRATGRVLKNDPASRRFEGPITIASAFDFDQDKLRFERAESTRITEARPDGTKVADMVIGGKMLREGNRITASNHDSALVNVGSLNSFDGKAIRPLDVRKFGLFLWSDLVSFPTADFAAALQYRQQEQPESITEERRGVWRILWRLPAKGSMILQRQLWVDQNQGFSPIRMEYGYRPDSMPAAQRSPLTEESETTWTQVAGVWVPQSSRIVTDPQTPTSESYEFSFDWDLVNGVVPPVTWTVANLKLVPGSPVNDNSLGKSIRLGRINFEHQIVDRSPNWLDGVATERVIVVDGFSQGWGRATIPLLIGLGVLALGLAGCLLVRSRRVARSGLKTRKGLATCDGGETPGSE